MRWWSFLGVIGYELDFAFCEKPGFPPKALLTCFRRTADEVIECLDYVGREHLYSIQLTQIDDINEIPRSSVCARPPKWCKIGP